MKCFASWLSLMGCYLSIAFQKKVNLEYFHTRNLFTGLFAFLKKKICCNSPGVNALWNWKMSSPLSSSAIWPIFCLTASSFVSASFRISSASGTLSTQRQTHRIKGMQKLQLSYFQCLLDSLYVRTETLLRLETVHSGDFNSTTDLLHHYGASKTIPEGRCRLIKMWKS